MTTFTVASNVSYAGVPTGVDLIDFTNAIHTVATATFNAVDFDNVKIKDNVIVSASAGTNNIVVNGGVDASGWTFDTSPAWSAADSITFNGISGADIIIGSSQNDTIIGGLGADTLVGGDGDDTFVYNASTEFSPGGETIAGGNGTADTLRINVGEGLQINVSGVGALSGVEKVVFTSAGAGKFSGDNLGTAAGLVNAVTGSAGENRITVIGSNIDLTGVAFTAWTAGEDLINLVGTGGNDTIVGSSRNDSFGGEGGIDSLSGAAGDDEFNLESDDFVVGSSINGGSGTDDRIRTESADLSVGTVTGVERLIVGGLTPASFAGAALSGSQIGAGAITTITGSSQSNILTVKGALVNLTGVTFNTWTDGSDVISIDGADNAANTLTGSNRNDQLFGGSKSDVLNGGAGADELTGGLGNDTYVLGAGSDTVSDKGGAADIITSTISRSLAGFGTIEKLTLLGAAVTGTGNGLANTITGNASANTLDGKAGGDTLRGLGGNDTYVVDSLGDVVDESAAGSGGTDTVLSSVNLDLGGGTAKFVSLAAAAAGLGSVENLTLTGSAKEATGNDLANVITGNASANVLDGGDGADSLFGSDGADRLIGGLGPDLFTGGIGGDTFVLALVEDSGKKASARDTILDFTAEDFIDLSAIDAKKGGKDNHFKFIKKQDFHDKKGELHYQKKGGDLVVSGDVNGDGKADFSILVDDLRKLAGADFVL